MSGICSAHKHYEKGCRLCEAIPFKPCHEFTQPDGQPPEECFEGTAKADECMRLEKGQYWDECPHGGRWRSGKDGKIKSELEKVRDCGTERTDRPIISTKE